MLGSKFVKYLMSILKLQLDSFPNFVSLFIFLKDISSVLSLAQTTYTLLKRSLLNWNFLRLLSAQFKICQIPYANFETTSGFLCEFCIPLQFHERELLCTFLVQTIYTFLKKNPLKWNFLRLSSAHMKIRQIPHVNFVMASHILFKFCVFFIVMTDNSCLDFKRIIFKVWIKGSHQNPSFQRSGKKIAIFPMSFSKPEISWK